MARFQGKLQGLAVHCLAVLLAVAVGVALHLHLMEMLSQRTDQQGSNVWAGISAVFSAAASHLLVRLVQSQAALCMLYIPALQERLQDDESL